LCLKNNSKEYFMQACQGKTKAGVACRAPAGAGGLCFFHANPDSAKMLGQIGGRKNRRSVVDLQVPDNMSAADLRNVTAQAIRLLLCGEMQAREAVALAQLCNSLHRVIPTADLETRVTMLEAQLSQEESETSPDCDSTGAPTDGPEPAQTDALQEEEGQQQNPPSFDATADSEDGAAGGSDGSGEGEEA
jgi:hypothetical protein